MGEWRAADRRLLRQLGKLPLVGAIERERWPSLVPHIAYVDLAEGDTLFRAGRESERLYLVVDGELGLDLPRADGGAAVRLQRRGRGSTAGDFAVLNGGAHLVTAVATRRSRVAGFPRFAFELLTDLDPSILAHVYDTAAELSRRVTLARVFINLFGELDSETLEALLAASTVHHYRSGETLFRAGDAADGLYVVVSGRLHVVGGAGDRRRRVAAVQPPQTVGELALLGDTARSATVYAARESTVAKLDRTSFQRLIVPRAPMLLALARLVVRRNVAQEHEGEQRPPDRNFVIVPLDTRLPLRRFLHQLKRALRAEGGDPLALDARGFDTLYGKSGASTTRFDDPFNGAVAEWLDERENRHPELIYVADPTLSTWTQRAVNRADRILLLANADPGNEPARREIERALEQSFADRAYHPRVDLVLLHAPDRRHPSGTLRWLAPRRLDAFHHVRLDDTEHFGRLSRRLRGRARALVFSGGGARGYAHLGVQRLIEEEGIRVDVVGGSSMGGLLGAAMALGLDADAVEALSARFANRRALFDYTLPITSLMRSEKLVGFCREVYGETRIEDLWTPFFCVSSNLADGREVVHDSGPLWKAVRATISLPGIFSPVPTADGGLLIDGAVLNTFPVDVMRERLGGAGELIGVNVSEVPEQFERYGYGASLSGWRVLLSRLNPMRPAIHSPRIVETLLRSTDIKGIDRLEATRAQIDVLVEPDVARIALLDFKRYGEISAIGYAAAREVFAAQGLCASDAKASVARTPSAEPNRTGSASRTISPQGDPRTSEGRS